eukprot:scaffold1291_cov319-Chaetoceros_neogracile.AAC.1
MGKKIKTARVQAACGGRSETSKDERERTIEYLYSCSEEKPPPPSALKEESGAFLSPSGIKRSREVESIVNKYYSATKKPRTAAAVGIADDRGDADSCASPSNKKGRRVGAPPDSESSRAWAESLGPPRSEPFSPGVFKEGRHFIDLFPSNATISIHTRPRGPGLQRQSGGEGTNVYVAKLRSRFGASGRLAHTLILLESNPRALCDKVHLPNTAPTGTVVARLPHDGLSTSGENSAVRQHPHSMDFMLIY